MDVVGAGHARDPPGMSRAWRAYRSNPRGGYAAKRPAASCKACRSASSPSSAARW
ncbi:hypothetical protein D9M68_249270 [compost metagenome]